MMKRRRKKELKRRRRGLREAGLKKVVVRLRGLEMRVVFRT